jgi:hypothetical protein
MSPITNNSGARPTAVAAAIAEPTPAMLAKLPTTSVKIQQLMGIVTNLVDC